MRGTSLALGILLLLLLTILPVGAAPSLQRGDHASYDLSASISFLQPCSPIGVSISTNTVVCPMIATFPSTFDINGTLGWTATDLNSTTASLNVTRDLTLFNGAFGTPVAHSTRSFNESINLTNRIVTLLPLVMPEMEQAIQMAQSTIANGAQTGVDWSSSMSTLDNTLVQRPLYTVWWVNGPLKLNQTIPVLVLPTNVIGISSIDLGGTLGTRSAWTLVFKLSRPMIPLDPTATSSSAIPVGDNLELVFTFNYDQTSDLLLTANADIHLGFGEEMTIQPAPCDSSISSNLCPGSTSPTTILREFGFDIHAMLKLASTTVDLTHRMTQTGPSQNGNVSPGPGTGSGSGAGTSGSGTGTGSSPGTGPGSDSSSRTGGTTGGTGQATSSPGQATYSSAGWVPWIYGLLGILAIAVIGAGVWIARRKFNKTGSMSSSIQLPV
jgi:hypothetical protein